MSNVNEATYAQEYTEMSDFQLKKEFHRITRIPNARTNIEALTRMSALLGVMEEKGVEVPQARRVPGRTSTGEQTSGGPNIGTIALGAIIFLVGLVLTMSSDSIFYGAMIVGIAMVFKGLMS